MFVLYIFYSTTVTLCNAAVPQWDLDIVRRPTASNVDRLARRNSPIVSSLDLGTWLSLNATLGTPPQQLQFLVGIAAGDTIVLSKNAPYCQAHQGSDGCYFGVFDGNHSSTYAAIDENVDNDYTDGTYSIGTYATDTLTISGTSVNDFQFEYATNTTNNINILGLGYPGLEEATTPYDNLLYQLADANDIPLRAYSIWFEGENFEAGKLALGGIDTGKFSGSLQTVTITPPAHEQDRQYVLVDISDVYTKSNGTTLPIASSSSTSIISSNGDYMYVPRDVITTLKTLLDVSYDDASGTMYQTYADMKNGSTLGFNFSGATIDVPVQQLAQPINATHCYYEITLIPDGYPADYILGVSFLRSAYVVFDYDHNQISFQQTVHNNASNVTAISASGVAGLQGTFTTAAPPSNSSSPAPTASSTAKASHSGMSSATKIGIGVGVGVGVPLLILIAGLLFWTRRRSKQSKRTGPLEIDPAQPERQPERQSELPSATNQHFEPTPVYEEKSLNDKYSSRTTTELPSSPPQHYGSPINKRFSGGTFKEGPLSEYYESEATTQHG